MAVPRPLLLALLGSVLLAATFMAMRNSKNASDTVANPVVEAKPTAPAPSQQPAKQAGLDAQQAVRAVTAPGQPVKSARFNLRVSQGRDVVVAKGSFSRAADQPSFDVRFRDNQNGRRDNYHLISAAGSGFATRGGSAYKLGDFTIANTGRVRNGLKGDGASAAKLPQLDPVSFMKGLRAEAGGKLDGVDTTHVSGAIDRNLVAAGVRKLVRSAGQGPAPALLLPKGFNRELRRALKGARLDAYVGTKDRIARLVKVTAAGASVQLSLSQMNKPQQIAAPKQLSKRSLEGRDARTARGLYLASSVVVDPPAALSQMGVGYLRVAQAARAARIPRKVERVVRANREVVIFFSQSGSVDDPITARSVSSLRRHSRVAVFSDRVNNVAAYGSAVQSVGVTRAPSIVIIGKSGRARLIDGYIDPAALAQEVADTQ